MNETGTPTRHLSLFTIGGEDNGRVLTSAGGEFDTVSYSRFKYGDTHVANRYGHLLAGTILGCETFESAKLDPEHVVLTASAYKSLPTAAQAVVDSSVRTLHGYGYPIIGDGRIYRSKLTEGDYGAMSAEDRTYWMSRNGLWADEAKFSGADVIVIDDIRISGAHEASIINLFQTIDVRSVTLVHVLKLNAELAARDPTIEDRMNHAFIKDLSDLGRLISDHPSWAPNARAVKFILSHPAPDALQLLMRLPATLVERIHEGIMADGYDTMPSYREVAESIEQFVEDRRKATFPILPPAAA